MNFFQTLVSSALMLGSTTVLAQTCQEKGDFSGAYMFSHSVPIGNGMMECYMKAKDGTGEPTKYTIAFEDEPITETPEDSGDDSAPTTQPKGPLPECPKKTYRNLSSERIIESRLARGTSRQGFEKQLFSGIEVGLPGWERAHSQGSGTGTESPEAIYYAPREVNQKWQNRGVEDFLRDLVAMAPQDERLCLLTATTAHKDTLRLEEIQYKVTVLKAGESARTILEASIEVEDKRTNPAVTPKVTLVDLPDSMQKGKEGTLPSREQLRFCE